MKLFFSDHKPIFIGINTIDTLSNANNNINNADDDIDDNTNKYNAMKNNDTLRKG